MAVLYSEAPEGAQNAEPLPHKTWTRDELALLDAAGVLDSEHYELIEGELIYRRGKKQPHAISTFLTVNQLLQFFDRYSVVQHCTIDVAPEDNPQNEPMPDIVVLSRTLMEIGRTPEPSDIVLLVEVADSSLVQDLAVKAKLYARAGIPDYWVLDLNGRRMFVHRDPVAGLYGTRFEVDAKGVVEPLSKPGHAISLADILPKG